MNKVLLSLLCTLILLSCASNDKMQALKNESHDGLRFESLKRYNNKRLQPKVDLNNSLALCHLGQYNKVLEQLKSKLDKKLNSYIYWNTISTCYILQKEYTQAKKFLELAMGTAKTKTQKAIVLNNIGVIHLENKNFEEAKEHFKKSIEFSKVSLTPRYNITQIYLKFGLYRNAYNNLKILLASSPKDVDFLNSMGHLSLMQKKYKSALIYLDQIPQSYRSRDDVATNIAMTYYMLGLFEKTKITLDNADKIDKFYTNAQLEILKKVEKHRKSKK